MVSSEASNTPQKCQITWVKNKKSLNLKCVSDLFACINTHKGPQFIVSSIMFFK